MKVPFVLITLATLLGLGSWHVTVQSSAEDYFSSDTGWRLSMLANCSDPRTKAPVFDGTVDLLVEKSPTSGRGQAVVYDPAGRVSAAEAFGLTGEILVLIDGAKPITRRLEAGKSLQVDPVADGLLQCTFSESHDLHRQLTRDELDALDMPPQLAGITAEVSTSIHGLAWVRP
jgi:hypothetical protein